MDRKGIIIIAACILFMAMWHVWIGPTYFPRPIPKKPPPPAEKTPAPADETPAAAEEASVEPPAEGAPVEPPAEETPVEPPAEETPVEPPVEETPVLEAAELKSEGKVEDIVIENDTCEFTFSSLGGVLESVRLKKFTEDDRKTTLQIIRIIDRKTRPLGIELLDSKTDLRSVNYKGSASPSSAAFSLGLPNGLKIDKTMRLTEGKYDFAFDIEFSNTSSKPFSFTAKIDGPGSIVREDALQNYLSGAVQYLKNDKLKTASPKYGKVWQIPDRLFSDEVPTSDISMSYVGVRNRFFGSALLSDKPLIVRGMGVKPLKGPLPVQGGDVKTAPESVASFVVLAPIKLEPGESKKVTFTFFVGPQQTEVLAEYGPLVQLLDYGMFGIISRLMLVILRFFYAVTGNYVVAIILMTILVKLVLFPLARKGAISQRKQQKLAPKMKELQAKYKNNKQKLNQEMMKLYRNEGVSPVSGCLPMLMQLPVFIGLLRLLQYSIEIRQACFIPGWIDDLSKPDTIATLPAWMPIVQGRLNILPILMAVVSIIHQRMMPKPADPQQQQQMMMLKFMPLIFVVLLYNWASGLLLYWTVSTALGILEQHVLKKSLDVPEDE
jgi:YidC/Oxa1 family membrane protein insertase